MGEASHLKFPLPATKHKAKLIEEIVHCSQTGVRKSHWSFILVHLSLTHSFDIVPIEHSLCTRG